MNQIFLHQVDDQGFPLCRCTACREKSKTINAQYVNRMFSGIVARGTDEQFERDERDQDYVEGMK